MRSVMAGVGLMVLVPALMGPVVMGQAGKSAGNETHQFASDALNLRLRYPAQMETRDLGEATVHGVLSMPGLSEAPAAARSVEACLRPVLLLRTPEPATSSVTTEEPAKDGSGTTVRVTPTAAGTMMLAELDPNCLSEAEQVSGRKELPVMAQQFLATPGMVAAGQPASYTIGWQKVYLATAQGHPRTPPVPASDPQQQPAGTPFTIFSMAIATNWNSHLLVWLMSANQISLLDQMSKSTVRFGRAAEAPLYPLPMGNGSAASPSQ